MEQAIVFTILILLYLYWHLLCCVKDLSENLVIFFPNKYEVKFKASYYFINVTRFLILHIITLL